MSDGIDTLPDHLVEDHEHHPDAWNRHRGRFAPRRVKVHGKPLAQWAADIIAQDAQRIETAIKVGLAAGEDSLSIAHRVVGSAADNGVNGMTEVTRQHILRVGVGFLRKRKTRMGEAGQDVLPGDTEKTDET